MPGFRTRVTVWTRRHIALRHAYSENSATYRCIASSQAAASRANILVVFQERLFFGCAHARRYHLPQDFDVVDESDGHDGIVGGQSEDGEQGQEMVAEEVEDGREVVVEEV